MKKPIIIIFLLFAALFFILSKNQKSAFDKAQTEIVLESTKYGAYLLGFYSAINEESEAAATYFEKSLDFFPNNRVILDNFISSKLITGQIDDIFNKTKIIEKPGNFNIYLARIPHLMKHSKKQELEKIFSQPLNSPVEEIAKIWYYSFENKEKAKELLKKFQSNEPNTFPLEIAKILDFLSESDKEAAISAREFHDKLLSDTIKKTPLDFPNLVHLYAYFEKNDASKCAIIKDSFQKHLSDFYFYQNPFENFTASKFLPNNKDLTLNKAFSSFLSSVSEEFMIAKIFPESVIYARLSLYLDPENEIANFIIARNLFNMKFYEQSREFISKIKNDQMLKEDAQILLAKSLNLEGKSEDAIKILESIKNESILESVRIALGEIFLSNTEATKAVKVFEEIVEKSDKTINLWRQHYLIGSAYYLSDDYVLSEKNLIKALELKPNHPIIMNDLAYGWAVQNKNMEKAKSYIELALKKVPNDPSLIDTMGWILFQEGKLKESAEFLEKALDLKPNETEIMDHLSQVYAKIGRITEARILLQRAVFFLEDSHKKSPLQKNQQQQLKKFKDTLNSLQNAQ